MNSETAKREHGRTKAPRATVELLCLLAAYEAYGTGLGSSGCLRALAENRGK